ncbi:MAG: helix-turn-helix transcriptional regulator [Clostridia bacterium]|nr:helix-turn-helix transcriptional regulator [Clostridia bacterium]
MLNERIKSLRLNRSMSQVELADRLGVTKQSVSNWENDNIQPSIEMLVKIAKVFNVSTDYLLSLDDRKYIEVTGLSDQTIAHIQLLISDITTKE